MLIFNFICVIELILQCACVSKFNKTKDVKYYNLFMGFVWTIFVSAGLMYFYIFIELGQFSQKILWLIITSAFCFINVSQMKKVKISCQQSGIIQDKSRICVLFIIMMSVSMGVSLISTGLFNLVIGTKTIDYLNTKYGEHDFKVVTISRTYSKIGIPKEYEMRISSSILDETFFTYASGTIPLFINEFREQFFPDFYYENDLNKYLEKKYNYTAYVFLDNKKIPANLGHMPTYNELISFKAIKGNLAFRTSNTDSNFSENDVDSLIEMVMYLADYFKELDNLEFYVITSDVTLYSVELTKETLLIRKGLMVTYKYNKVDGEWILEYHFDLEL